MKTALVCCLTALLTASSPAAFADEVLRIPSSGGEVILPTARDKAAYDETGYAAARRVGDTLYLSGVIAGRRPGEGNDLEAFKAQTRRAFERIRTTLAASGATFDDVVMLNTFHVWQGPNFAGTRDEQFAAFAAVKREYMTGPSPAWTAVGTTGLLADGGIVEIQVIARVPAKKG